MAQSDGYLLGWCNHNPFAVITSAILSPLAYISTTSLIYSKLFPPLSGIVNTASGYRFSLSC